MIIPFCKSAGKQFTLLQAACHTSVTGNLLKGASGQAVYNMNLMFGLEERMGLHLKAGAF
ncbi:N-acetyl-gamma-glutamyl-phosphate reductase [Bacteroidales bacterium Barb6XT]|nr:N-acetyl-gamma-glutamyl-phosphate reductase [Bacteroidales bacterium Barb6XT]